MHPAVTSGGARCIPCPCDDSTCIDVTYSFCALSLSLPSRRKTKARAGHRVRKMALVRNAKWISPRELLCGAETNKERQKKAPANQIMHEAIFYCALTHSTSALPSIYCAALQFIEPAAAATSVPKPRGAHSPPTRKAAAAALLNSLFLSVYVRASHS
jgi:hypothetical protein